MPLTDKLKHGWSDPPSAKSAAPPAEAPAQTAAPPADNTPAKQTTAGPATAPLTFAAPGNDLGQVGILDKPANASYSDWLMAHIAEAGKGFRQLGSSADDFVRARTDYMTGGLIDRGAAAMSGLTGVGGGDLAQQRAQTQQAHSNLGPAGDLAAFGGGYGSGFGKLGPVAGMGLYSGVRSAQAGDDPTSAQIMTDPMKVGLDTAVGLGEGGVLGLASKGVGTAANYFNRPNPAATTFKRGDYSTGLGFSPGAGYPSDNMSAADLARFAREVTGIKQDDPAGANTMIDLINKALARSTPDQVNATRQAYQGVGGDVAGGGDAAAPSMLRRGLNYAATGAGGALGGWLGHQTGLPEARVGGAAAGGWVANKFANSINPSSAPGVYPALSGPGPPNPVEGQLNNFGGYLSPQALQALLGLGG
jgi:hypothetical protein